MEMISLGLILLSLPLGNRIEKTARFAWTCYIGIPVPNVRVSVLPATARHGWPVGPRTGAVRRYASFPATTSVDEKVENPERVVDRCNV